MTPHVDEPVNDVANVEGGEAGEEGIVAVAVALHLLEALQQPMSAEEVVQVSKEKQRTVAQVVA